MTDRSYRDGDPKLVRCPHTADGKHEWVPDPDDPDAGDVCALCCVDR